MLYHLLYPLHVHYSFFNVFQYITFRTIYATITALIISFIAGPWFIKKLTYHQIGEKVRKDGPERHSEKEGTPTMGGSLIMVSLIVPTLLWADLGNKYIWTAIFTTAGFGIIGYVDDMYKVKGRMSEGIKARYKFGFQVIISIAASYMLVKWGFSTELYFPFFKELKIDLGIFFIPFCVIVITGASNAVNLTDGLDGLAIGPVIVSSITYLLVAYFAGHKIIATYLQIPYIAGSGELAIFCGAMAGASLGFLWYNTYPAQVFMGDVGSLPLGAALGILAVITKHEILLSIVGGLFVIEALSVIFQVASYKTRKKRIFLMAPIHHHFELKGWAEPKIIVRFWIISIILALVGLSTLKLR
ncbi:MAG: phospho-N-acetylmuramoyl-pentapeptide-transferase [Deltaproteobacteria bacterium]|nr:phospho-N-acetylmuramoyl-pentapeptide-transferase [Deltaproteobacteria bacterium]